MIERRVAQTIVTMKITPTIMSFAVVISLILSLLIISPAYANIHSNTQEKIENIEFEDTILNEDFYNEIKQEVDQLSKEVEVQQDPKNWPTGETTFYSIPFYTFPTIISAVVLIILIIAIFIYWRGKKNNPTNIN